MNGSFAILLFSALALDALLGEPPNRIHPVALFGKLAGKVETFCRNHFGSGIGSGLLGWLFLTALAAAAAGGSTRLLAELHPIAGFAAAALWIDLAIAPRSLLEHAGRIEHALRSGNIDAARTALARIVSRDTAELDESEIVRGGIESLGENLVDAVTAALLFATAGFLVGGISGAAAAAVWFRAVNTLDACWGYRDERYLRFGRIAARADDLACALPSRLTLPVIALAAVFVGGSPPAAFRAGIRHRHDHPSPNSAFGMAGFAGALGIRLGGATRYGGEIEPYPYYCADGRAVLSAPDLRRAERLTAAATLLTGLLLAGGSALC